MKKRGVVDIEREFADDREEFGAILEIVNPHILRDEAAEGIEREPPHGGFHAAAAQFVGDGGAPLPAETFVRQIPAAEHEQREAREQEKARAGGEELAAPGPAAIEAARDFPPRRQIEDAGWHFLPVVGRAIYFKRGVISPMRPI